MIKKLVTYLYLIKVFLSDGGSVMRCDTPGYLPVKGYFGKETHWLCLKSKPIGSYLMSNQSVIILDPDAEGDVKSIKGFSLTDVIMAFGYPLLDPAMGSAEGYIGDDQHFYGVLHLGNRTIYADPNGQDDPTFLGVYENDNLAGPMRERRFSKSRHTGDQLPPGQFPMFPFVMEQRTQTPGVASARICELLLLADKEFFEKDANSSLDHAVKRMVHAVAQADIIFRNTDFNEDGVPDNIGFSVKYILILASNETNTRVFGDLSGEIDGRAYLMRFARLRRLSEVCLGVAFSGLAFTNRTLGLSFTSLGGGLSGAAGGLCDRRAFGRSFNTLALAHATNRERVPERVAALTLAHELGHSFGAHHDDNFPNPKCRGYLMGAQSTVGETDMRYEFSVCSKRLISSTLNGMSYCLIEEELAYCGNGIVEIGEACDCGLPSLCSKRDPCCTPRTGGVEVFETGTLLKEGCTVAPTASCHPSQGICCQHNCKYADLSKSGIDCKTQEQRCACKDLTCRCGLNGRCLSDGSCHATECATLGLRECYCQKSSGGTLGRGNMCGVCCQLPAGADDSEGECVSAELAALEALENNTLPLDWPNEYFNGPVTTLVLCAGMKCRNVTLRAWSTGEPCVSAGLVGRCSHGICLASQHVPRSNTYPDLQSIQLHSVKARSLSKCLIARINLIMATCVVNISVL